MSHLTPPQAPVPHVSLVDEGILRSDRKVRFSSVQYPKFSNAKPNHPFCSAVFRNLEWNVAFRFKKRLVHVRTQFERKRELGSTGRSACTSVAWRRRDSLVGVLRAIPMDLPPRRGAGGCGHARGGGELARGQGEGRTVEELLVELGAARVVARGDRAYWEGISGERGRTRGDKSHISCEHL